MEIRKQLTLKPDDRLTPIAGTRPARRRCPRCGTTTPAASSTCAPSPRCSHRGLALTAVDEAQARLWELAIHLEEGATDRTARGAGAGAPGAARGAGGPAARRQGRSGGDRPAHEGGAGGAAERTCRRWPSRRGATPIRKQFDPDAHRLDARDMQRLAEQMREAARAGRHGRGARQVGRAGADAGRDEEHAAASTAA